MPPNVTLTYVGPYDEVEIAATGQTCPHGATVEVSAEIAGRAPSGTPESGTPGEDGYVAASADWDPGEGLLAQTANWQPTKPAKGATKDGD